MRYKITKQYARGNEIACGEFNDIKAARSFIEEKKEADAALKIAVQYRLYEFGEVIEESNSSSVTQGAQGETSRGRSASFNPTPFNSAPRPAGIPHNWVKDQPDEEKKK